MRSWRAVAVVATLAAACGGSGSMSSTGTAGGTSTPTTTPPPSSGGTTTGSGTSTGSFVITISGLAFAPLNLTVPPGATVTVDNRDAMLHSVTSEATPGAFTPGSVSGVSFDTGAFSTGTRTFTIPASAPGGTVIPYYCTAHLATMATPNGSITVSASASPGAAPATPTQAPMTPAPMPMPGSTY